MVPAQRQGQVRALRQVLPLLPLQHRSPADQVRDHQEAVRGVPPPRLRAGVRGWGRPLPVRRVRPGGRQLLQPTAQLRWTGMFNINTIEYAA